MNLRRMQFISSLCALVCATFISQAGQHTALWAWGAQAIPPLDKDTRFKAVAAGTWHNLAITTNSTVVAWGFNHLFGQSEVPAGLSNVVAVAVGQKDSIALKSDGTIVVWGDNTGGWLTVPTGLSNVTAIAAGGDHRLALKADGTLVSWGRYMQTVPDGLSNVVAIAAGWRKSVALTSEGNVIHWGTNGAAISGPSEIVAITHSYGLRADGTVISLDVAPTPSSGLSNVVAIASGAEEPYGSDHALALKSDGTVVAWKTSNWEYNEHLNVPAGLTNVSAISAGHRHSLVLKTDGTLVAWGESTRSQSVVPTDFNDLVAIATGFSHQLALRKDGSVFAWGKHADGQINVPNGLSNIVAVAAGGNQSAVIKADGRIVIWGELFPDWDVLMTNLTNAVAIAIGHDHGLALSSSGELWTWGRNTFGQRNIPQGLSNVVAIAAGQAYSAALKDDGSALVWGWIQRNYLNYRDLVAVDDFWVLRANGSIVSYDNGENRLPPMTNIIAIASGRYHRLALTRESTVIAGGDNTYGQRVVPAGLKHVVAIAASEDSNFVLVNIAPEIRPQVSGANLVISWPISIRNYTLQSSETLAVEDSWSDMEIDPVMENSQNVITLPLGNGQRYFRLVRVED